MTYFKDFEFLAFSRCSPS